MQEIVLSEEQKEWICMVELRKIVRELKERLGEDCKIQFLHQGFNAYLLIAHNADTYIARLLYTTTISERALAKLLREIENGKKEDALERYFMPPPYEHEMIEPPPMENNCLIEDMSVISPPPLRF